MRAARTKAEATDLRHRLLREIDASDGWSLVHEQKTFSDLCDYYSTHYACEPVYVDGRKVAGLRSYGTIRGQLKVLRVHFGARALRSIHYEDLRAFKFDRLKAKPVWVEKAIARITAIRIEADAAGSSVLVESCDEDLKKLSCKQRKIASVHRELALLNRMLGVAARQRWILANPFEHGEPLISPADEEQRQTILNREQEALLLAACDHASRRHLRPILLLALDTGIRQGEILKLVWSDIDFDRSIIVVRAFNTKTMKSREVGMTPRVRSALQKLRKNAEDGSPETRIFTIRDNVKRSFTAARNAAGLPTLRFHDLRHTAATRLAVNSLSLSQIGRVLGHTQPRTTYRYVNANEETTNRAAEILAEYGRDPTGESVEAE